MALSTADWNAIKWYRDQFGYTIRDLMKGPMVVFRNKNDQQVDVNIQHIKDKYKARPRGKKKVEA